MSRKTPEDLLQAALDKIEKSTDETRTELQEMRKDMSSLASTGVKHQAILEEHIRRTEANEKALEMMGSRIAPLEKHVWMWGGVGKGLAVLAGLASITAAIWKIFFS